ncbi:MAG: hypothetical protein Q8R91_08620 [Candidatus Omnitrophota bacterium]|nr:hypothetical protein [Candidatus Omnitrophota bacterium]
MNALEQAVGALARFLDERRIPYMVIGGIANLVWGEPRATLDVDATVLVEETAWPALLRDLRRTFHVLPKKPLEFLRETHVLPVESREGVRVDVIWATMPYEHQAIARATLEQVASQRVRVCRPEDLIIHKIISNRTKDRDDVQAVIRHQGPRLDRRYLTKMVGQLSKTLDQPELLAFLNSCFLPPRTSRSS